MLGEGRDVGGGASIGAIVRDTNGGYQEGIGGEVDSFSRTRLVLRR